MSKSKGTPTLGIILVIVGLALLLNALDLYDFHWSYILIIIGAAFFVLAFTGKDKGAVFPGAILLLLGLFYLLRHYYILDDSMRYLWPVFPAMVGIAFLALYIFRPSDWGLLIPAGILLFFGIAGLGHSYRYWYYSPWELLWRYWPLALIAVGARLIVTGKRRG